MLFYPDQYFYHNAQQPRARSGERSRRSQPQPRAENYEFRPYNPWDQFFYGGDFPTASRSTPRRKPSRLPEEYYVVDEEELAALKAYRESKRRQQELAERREAQIARKRAEYERREREQARRQAEAEMRAQVEANAKAAARDYFRRKQAQQLALQKAQQEERQLRQQRILEELRNQFGFLMTPIQTTAEAKSEEDNAKLAEGSSEEANREESNREPSHRELSGEEESSSRRQAPYDPIRSLIEALAPFPIIFASESSDEEEERCEQDDKNEKDQQQRSNASSSIHGNSAQHDEEDETDKSSEPSGYYSNDDEEDEDGPICETASETSEPAFVEFIDPLARPPVYPEPQEVSPSEGEDDEIDHIASRKDSAKERQTKVPRSRRTKKAKHNDKKKRESISEGSANLKTSAEVSGLLHALQDDLQRIKEGFERIKELPIPTDIKEAVSRIEGIRIGSRRSEEIYDKLDEIRVGKDQRKLKHEITTEAVALAEKFEQLLNEALDEKSKLSKSSVKEGSPKHQVTLEEVVEEEFA